ncbi:helix-turn-helix domain-containing protein [Methylomonas sp. MK1]|uniref:helix-turn-helix domain-containing protein n=1 Tax=Methylomonas sp. MK1 TaxID=1131552 RepID=UPI00035CA46A|nr:helix-turn-helix transcriptional regulator [Methylomonas sp. MK1]
MAIKSFKQLLADAKQTDAFWFEKAKLDFSVAFNKMFARSGMTQVELAKKLNTSPAYINKVFKADANFTIETMTKLARSVDGNLQIFIIPQHPAASQLQLTAKASRQPQIYNGKAGHPQNQPSGISSIPSTVTAAAC